MATSKNPQSSMQYRQRVQPVTVRCFLSLVVALLTWRPHSLRYRRATRHPHRRTRRYHQHSRRRSRPPTPHLPNQKRHPSVQDAQGRVIRISVAYLSIDVVRLRRTSGSKISCERRDTRKHVYSHRKLSVSSTASGTVGKAVPNGQVYAV